MSRWKDRPARLAWALARAIRVLRMLTETQHGYFVTEIAKILGCSKRTIFRDIQALEMAGYSFDRHPQTRRLYALHVSGEIPPLPVERTP